MLFVISQSGARATMMMTLMMKAKDNVEKEEGRNGGGATDSVEGGEL